MLGGEQGSIEAVRMTRGHARRGRGAALNAVAPGGVVTDFGGGALRDPCLQQAVAAETPLGRIGEPEDVAGVIAALLAPSTRWVTGQRLEVTGGYRL